jgi:pimeloyl-ACP methyl ester carboxylesterase
MSADVSTTVMTVASKDGTSIAYEKVGTGPAIVLVDGALCYRNFGPARSVAAELADRFTVYFYDRRGRGESGNTLPYNVDREIEDLAAVMAATGERPFVMGQSSGGALALAAASAGVAMRKLAVYEPPYVGQKAAKSRPVDYGAELTKRVESGNLGGAVGYFLVTMVGAPAFVPLMMRLNSKVWKQLTGVAHTLPYDAAVLGDFSVPIRLLEKIAVPTLVMNGGKSPANMQAAVKAVADAVPNARYSILDGQTHQVSEKVLAPALVEFFD